MIKLVKIRCVGLTAAHSAFDPTVHTMKRIEEKVKDIVDVRSHGSIVNFGADPSQTVSGYHFTDVTSDLMSKWLNRASRITDGNGAANALAGFRGVGKSHFLATLGALLGHPELRSRITDTMVGSTAHALARRQFPVAFIRRGTHQTLIDELKYAISPIMGIVPEQLNDSLSDLLMQVTRATGDLPLILLIDTAFERSERVSRDDGAVLAEIAEIGKRIGIFVGIALDDDIAGADGINSGISKSFAIDYLDQEHLYKIVDSHIFPKHQRMRGVLHDIYEYYRQVVPGFRWSEQRFTSLYPLHPSIMEISPFVRLYLHEFALLGFASEAGARILGRPANSLIAPDEVFDNVEKSIRSVEILNDSFISFDKLNETVVAKTPVMKRLQAKLILKGLFLFSLNDEGATAAEIGASMLIFDENDPQSAVTEVEAMLTAFAEAMPSHIQVNPDNNGELRFAFKLFDKDDLKTALEEAVSKVKEQELSDVVKKLMSDRFSDCSFTHNDSGAESTDCFVVWRGGNRKGRVFWDPDESLSTISTASQNTGYEWNAVINFEGSKPFNTVSDPSNPIIVWKTAPLRDDEKDTLRRLSVLQSNPNIRSEFIDHISAAIQSHSVAAEKIFHRTFLIDGLLSIEGFEYNFTEQAREAQSLSQVTTVMLESFFEGRFPSHPYFPQMIRMQEVSTLVSDFLSGARPMLDEVQWLASTYAVPLGIVEKQGDVLVPVNAERLAELPLVDMALRSIDQASGSEDLYSVFKTLNAAPYGLVREAAYLLLAAMAGARLIEFVTSSGDRINRRSLDLKIIWDDVVAVARPAVANYQNARLVWWASKLSENKTIRSLEKNEDRTAILAGLQEWHGSWEKRNISKRFEEISDDSYNARIWRLATISLQAFGVTAEAINSVVLHGTSLEACLERIADVFSDSEAEFERRKLDLITVDDFLAGADVRSKAMAYISLCEYTGDESIDAQRMELHRMIEQNFADSKSITSDDLTIMWDRFRRNYSAYYVDKHDMTTASRDDREKLNEIMATDIWREFDAISQLPGFDVSYNMTARQIILEIQRKECVFKVAEMLEISPFCGCPFQLSDIESEGRLPNALWETINEGANSFRNFLVSQKDHILGTIANGIDMTDPELVDGAKRLKTALNSNEKIGRLTSGELKLVKLSLLNTSQKKDKPVLTRRRKTDSPTPEWDATVVEIEELLESVA